MYVYVCVCLCMRVYTYRHTHRPKKYHVILYYCTDPRVGRPRAPSKDFLFPRRQLQVREPLQACDWILLQIWLWKFLQPGSSRDYCLIQQTTYLLYSSLIWGHRCPERGHMAWLVLITLKNQLNDILQGGEWVYFLLHHQLMRCSSELCNNTPSLQWRWQQLNLIVITLSKCRCCLNNAHIPL